MASLLDSADPVMSLLGNLASVGQVGSSDAGGVSPSGGTLLSSTQRSVANDSLLAAGAALANAGAARFGPQPTLAQGLTQGLLAGSIAGQSAQERATNQQQAEAIMAQSAQDAENRRKLIEQHLNRGDLVTGFIKKLLVQRQPPADQAAPAGEGEGEVGGRPGDAIRAVLRGQEQDQRGYGSVNAAGFTGAFQIGSDLAADAGLYLPADTADRKNQWRGTFRIPGHPDVKTRDDFLRSGPAQEQAFTIASGHIDKILRENGVYDRVAAKGNVINGMPVTRDGLIMGAWLGGVHGLTQWVDKGTDARDGNNTSVSSYVRLGSQASGARPAAVTAASAAGPSRGVQVAEGGASPVLTDAGGTAPPGPAASRPQATRGDTSGILAGATQEQLIGILMSDDPAKALVEFANKPPHTIKDYNPSSGQMEVYRADNNNRKIGPPIAREAPTFEQHQEVINGETRWVRTIPGTKYREVGGIAPREIKQIREWDPVKKVTMIYNLGADGKKTGEGFLSDDVPKTVDVKGPDGQPWVGYVYPGQDPVPVAPKPTPPELAPKTRQRVEDEYRQAHPYTPAEKLYEEELGKKEAAMVDAGARAPTIRGQVQAFLALQNDLNTGIAAEKWGTVGQWLDTFGLGDKTGIPGFGRNAAVTQPALRAIRQQLVQQMMSGPDGFGHNQISDADLKTLQGANISVGNDPGANKVIGSLTLRFIDKQEAMRDAWTEKLAAARDAGETRPRFDTWVTREWKKDPRNVELLPTVTPAEVGGLAPGTVHRRRGQPGIWIIPGGE